MTNLCQMGGHPTADNARRTDGTPIVELLASASQNCFPFVPGCSAAGGGSVPLRMLRVVAKWRLRRTHSPPEGQCIVGWWDLVKALG